MFIVLVGGGKIGFHLIRALIEQHHEVVLVERDPRTAEMVFKTFEEVPVIVGDGTNPEFLRRAGIDHADVVVAVAGRDQDNFVICEMAKRIFGVKRALARVNDPRNEELFKLAGVDRLISVTAMVARAIEYEVVPHKMMSLLQWHDEMAVMEIDLMADSPVVGLPVRKLDLPELSELTAIWRGGHVMLPRADTVLEAGDAILATTLAGHENALRQALLGPAKAAQAGGDGATRRPT